MKGKKVGIIKMVIISDIVSAISILLLYLTRKKTPEVRIVSGANGPTRIFIKNKMKKSDWIYIIAGITAVTILISCMGHTKGADGSQNETLY